MADPPPYPGAPRWVKVAGLIAIALVVVLVVVLVTGIGGPHGPGRHLPSQEAGGTLPPGATEQGTPSGSGASDQTPPAGGY